MTKKEKVVKFIKEHKFKVVMSALVIIGVSRTIAKRPVVTKIDPDFEEALNYARFLDTIEDCCKGSKSYIQGTKEEWKQLTGTDEVRGKNGVQNPLVVENFILFGNMEEK